MDKYRKIMKPKDEKDVKSDDEIRVTAQGSVSAYVAYAAKVYNELEKPKVVVTGTGNALAKAVTAAEIIKRRFKGLHQITKLGNIEIVDEYEPLEEGLDKVVDTRSMSFVEITLSKEALDTKDKGYQPPLDESEITEYSAEEVGKSRGRGRGRGGGRGKGKGKGKSKGKDDGSPKGKGKGKGKDGKGKGKGKGKDESPGKGKSKGKSKGKDESPAKGKGKGKSKDKGKSKGYDSWDSYGYSSAPAKGKGKKGGGKGKSSGWDDGGYGGWGGGSGWDSWDNSGSWGGGKSGGGKSKGKGGKSKGKYNDSYWY